MDSKKQSKTRLWSSKPQNIRRRIKRNDIRQVKLSNNRKEPPIRELGKNEGRILQQIVEDDSRIISLNLLEEENSLQMGMSILIYYRLQQDNTQPTNEFNR